jgi:hypothetical protein
MVPIQIKAQMLRRWPRAGHADVVGPFAIMPDDGAGAPEETAGGPRKPWRQSDVKRAVAAAEQAGLQSYRVEIAPDGTISIIVGAPADSADPGPGGDAFGV